MALKCSWWEYFRALNYRIFQGPKMLQFEAFQGPKILRFGAFQGPKIEKKFHSKDIFFTINLIFIFLIKIICKPHFDLHFQQILFSLCKIVPSESSHVEYPQVRLGQVLGRHDPLGRRLESWFGLGQSHGQTLLTFLGRGCKTKQLSFPQLLLI